MLVAFLSHSTEIFWANTLKKKNIFSLHVLSNSSAAFIFSFVDT